MVNCPTCKSEVRYIEKNQRYYCDACKAWQNIQGAPQGAAHYKIVGSIAPVLEYKISPQNILFGQPGLMVSRDPSVIMQNKTKGGLVSGLGKKLLTGETLTQMEYTGQGTLRLSAGYTGKLIDIKLQGTSIRAKSGAYIAAEAGVDVGTTTEKLGTAIIGGTGLFQLIMSGQGTVFLQSVGDIIEGNLAPGQSLIIDENHFLACDNSVSRDRERVKGVRNIVMGGEGLYTLKMTGPGRYWIETGNLFTMTAGARQT